MTKEKGRKLRAPQAVNNSGKIIMVKSGAPFRHRWRFAYPPNKTNYAPMQGGYTCDQIQNERREIHGVL